MIIRIGKFILRTAEVVNSDKLRFFSHIDIQHFHILRASALENDTHTFINLVSILHSLIVFKSIKIQFVA